MVMSDKCRDRYLEFMGSLHRTIAAHVRATVPHAHGSILICQLDSLTVGSPRAAPTPPQLLRMRASTAQVFSVGLGGSRAAVARTGGSIGRSHRPIVSGPLVNRRVRDFAGAVHAVMRAAVALIALLGAAHAKKFPKSVTTCGTATPSEMDHCDHQDYGWGCAPCLRVGADPRQ